jgi:hypothetical protein
MRAGRKLIAFQLALACVISAAAPAGAEDEGLGAENRRRAAAGPRVRGEAALASSVDCEIAARVADLEEGLNLDCDGPHPNNEPHIAVNPTDPRHLVASSNDFDSCCDQFYTSFDGGRSWVTGNLSRAERGRVGSDPVTAFNPRHRTVLHASLSFTVGADGDSGDGDVVTAVSRDGGIRWDRPLVVADGWGDSASDDQVFNDKPWLAVDTSPQSPHYGRSYLAWSRFRFRTGRYVESPIWLATSDDGGRSWSKGREISGEHSLLCASRPDPKAARCSGAQAPSVVVGRDGSVSVAYLNNDNPMLGGDGDDQYLIVRSTDGGATFSAPQFVVGLETGSNDYPRNIDGQATLAGAQIRLAFPGAGGLAVSRRTGRLYLVFSDNRAGRHAARGGTDTNVYLMTSPDGRQWDSSPDGRQWDGPAPVTTAEGDQWLPTVDVNPVTDEPSVLFYDGNVRGNGRYGATLAVRAKGAFSKVSVAPAVSDWRRSRFFRSNATGCPDCTKFMGDYLGLAHDATGRAWAAWTDMRGVTRFEGASGRSQHVFVRRINAASFPSSKERNPR